ncbi:CpaD family pilus assembly protein [Hyphomicrobium sp.]|uniref:CpaD family pilus assembly protein n=1 Tax=Hyphomicrobium sp. TaxID=82 RepID=UPI002D78B26A|nr:CpaD family pilus assembly protein [Hyphomicrobium sp.]HET6388664.1 CpaD family pilus assembly protein [Hyphomicrobium sp.]
MQIKCTTERLARTMRSGTVKLLVAALIPMMVAGCRQDAPGPRVAGWTLIDPEQRHPILVSQQPASLNLKVAASAEGLTPMQRARVLEFAGRSKAADAGNSRIVISAPGGSMNESAAMQAADETRQLMIESGYSETAIAVEAYHADSREAPLRLSYMRYVAEAPECGRDWSENLARNYQNTPYPNFGCSSQRNLAVMVSNPSDLLGPRTMTGRDANRRDDMYKKYVSGAALGAEAEKAAIKAATGGN